MHYYPGKCHAGNCVIEVLLASVNQRFFHCFVCPKKDESTKGNPHCPRYSTSKKPGAFFSTISIYPLNFIETCVINIFEIVFPFLPPSAILLINQFPHRQYVPS